MPDRPRLSVNINKVALLRNARRGNLPDLYRFAAYCEECGAEGITVHPRPDERHIRRADIPVLRELVKTEFNVEGYPSEDFLRLVEQNHPEQVTLVPDPPGALTSESGWDPRRHRDFLTDVVTRLSEGGMRVSLFLDPVPALVEAAARTGAHRIELYTGEYANAYATDRRKAIAAHVETATKAREAGLGINAGHDLNLVNLAWYASMVDGLLEVSIGHALIADALYYGIRNTINMYLEKLEQKSSDRTNPLE